ncbi:Rossmann-like and DUF2520 domain-containing protein [uncultured Microbulbifer sp.]|uniref:Rossmann-like and DUF2520 domain-containing protein n=1 Tax=uncultured Microbulbifer sp. TaxID=348147 RepID=UPI002628102A|nr:Rossmann-like and DUF2520 domain-containing protein [uncultured Microbulbifer sp.]
MHTPKLRTLNIIGAGNLGRTLARLWSERGVFRVGNICNRTLASATDATAFIGAGAPVADIQSMAPADFWLIAVADDHIEAVAAELAIRLQSANAEAQSTGATPVVFHCSGALSSSALTACAPAKIASAHPVHSFADPERSVNSLAGTFVALEGDALAREYLEGMFAQLDCTSITLSPEQKVLYHTGSVIACNYLTVLMDLSLQTFAAAGIDENTARKLLEPIVLQTAKNNFALGPENALTGPLARGDLQTVTRQLGALTEVAKTQPQAAPPPLADIYRLLGKAALPMATRAGLDSAVAHNFQTLFDNPPQVNPSQAKL